MKTKPSEQPDSGVPNPKPKRILLPLDFSDPSRRALKLAREWAKFFGARVYLLFVIEPLPYMSGMESLPLTKSSPRVAAEAKTALDRLVREELPAPIQTATLVRQGKAYEQIVAAAQSLRIDLIIIGTHGYGGLSRVLLGSTAERVVRHAPCSVLTVRRRDL